MAVSFSEISRRREAKGDENQIRYSGMMATVAYTRAFTDTHTRAFTDTHTRTHTRTHGPRRRYYSRWVSGSVPAVYSTASGAEGGRETADQSKRARRTERFFMDQIIG